MAPMISVSKNNNVNKFQINKKSSCILDIKKEIATLDGPKPTKNLLPPLLKFYLKLGGKVSDHAVIDRELDTLHVFTYVNLKGKKINYQQTTFNYQEVYYLTK